jgi:hypothetical protein
MNKDQFIQQYVASYLAGMYVKRSDDHIYTGQHVYSEPSEIPIEDAFFMANVAWLAYVDNRGDMSDREWMDRQESTTKHLVREVASDVTAAEKARREDGSVPWSDLKNELGL